MNRIVRPIIRRVVQPRVDTGLGGLAGNSGYPSMGNSGIGGISQNTYKPRLRKPHKYY